MRKFLPVLPSVGLLLLFAAGAACNSGGKSKDKGGHAHDEEGSGDNGSGSNGTGSNGTGGSNTSCLHLDADDAGATDSTIDNTSDGSVTGTDAVTGTSTECIPSTNNGTGNGTGGTMGGGWNPGPGLEQCNAQGMSWIAVVNSGPAACGEPLVDWCCSEQEVLRRFPSMATQIQSQFQANTAAGLKLYNCSRGNSQTSFHWAMVQSGGGISYKSFSITGAEAAVTANTQNCIVVTSADLGITAGGDGGNGVDGTTGGGTSTLPASIGDITNTAKAGVLAWLKQATYRQWSKQDSQIRSTSSPHGNVKSYFNTQAQTAMTSGGSSFAFGSIIVTERYDSANMRGIAVMAKASSAGGGGNWLFYEIYDPAGNFVTPASESYGLGAGDCVSCHKASGTGDTGVVKSTLP